MRCAIRSGRVVNNLKRVTIPLDVQKDGVLDKLSTEEMKKILEAQLNYGWHCIEIKRLENAAYDYRLTVEWRKDSEPTVPPFPPKR